MIIYVYKHCSTVPPTYAFHVRSRVELAAALVFKLRDSDQPNSTRPPTAITSKLQLELVDALAGSFSDHVQGACVTTWG